MKASHVIWAAVLAGVIGGLVLIRLHDADSSNPSSPALEQAEASASVAAGASSSRAALQRCQLMAQPDDACRQLWADNRRHFLGLDTSSSAAAGD